MTKNKLMSNAGKSSANVVKKAVGSVEDAVQEAAKDFRKDSKKEIDKKYEKNVNELKNKLNVTIFQFFSLEFRFKVDFSVSTD